MKASELLALRRRWDGYNKSGNDTMRIISDGKVPVAMFNPAFMHTSKKRRDWLAGSLLSKPDSSMNWTNMPDDYFPPNKKWLNRLCAQDIARREARWKEFGL